MKRKKRNWPVYPERMSQQHQESGDAFDEVMHRVSAKVASEKYTFVPSPDVSIRGIRASSAGMGVQVSSNGDMVVSTGNGIITQDWTLERPKDVAVREVRGDQPHEIRYEKPRSFSAPSSVRAGHCTHLHNTFASGPLRCPTSLGDLRMLKRLLGEYQQFAHSPALAAAVAGLVARWERDYETGTHWSRLTPAERLALQRLVWWAGAVAPMPEPRDAF